MGFQAQARRPGQRRERKRSGWSFCCLHRNQRALVVDLQPGASRYRRLVLGVEDADAALALIGSARRQA